MKACLLVGAMLAVQSVIAYGQKSAPQQYQVIDYDAPPPSLEALWDQTPLVARVRIESAGTTQLPTSRADLPGTVVTTHRAHVLEVLKGSDVQMGSSIDIAVPVGKLPASDRPAIVASSAGMRTFTPGEEILVFLKWWDAASAYNVSFGPVGHYGLSSDSVTLPAASSRWPAFSKLGPSAISKQDFLATVRSLKGRPLKEPEAR